MAVLYSVAYTASRSYGRLPNCATKTTFLATTMRCGTVQEDWIRVGGRPDDAGIDSERVKGGISMRFAVMAKLGYHSDRAVTIAAKRPNKLGGSVRIDQ